MTAAYGAAGDALGMHEWWWGLVWGGTFLVLFLTALAVGAFFALRGLVLWYWRRTEQLELLEEIRDLLRLQAAAARSVSAPGPAPVPARPPVGSTGAGPRAWALPQGR